MTINQNEKPLLLIDIDGVLNLFDAWVPSGPAYWTTNGVRKQPKVAPAHLVETVAQGYSLLLNPDHPEMFEELAEMGELVWATMWQSSAYLFGQKAGFGVDWDYIDFDSYKTEYQYGTQRRIGNGVGTYKHPGIVDTLGDRPGVWVDDDMTPEQHAWAQRRTEAGIPTLFIQPDPQFGMTWEHFIQIVEFIESLDSTSTLGATA